MANIDQAQWDALIWRVEALAEGRTAVVAGPRTGEPMRIIEKLVAVAADVAELKGRAPVALTEADRADIAARVAAQLAPALVPLVKDAARAVIDTLAQRLAS